ncbi:MAG TPA: hypothetical protein VKR38_07620 [Usitatibacter sp.]|nr:hypothetical protein [Usitatibacter sp.]
MDAVALVLMVALPAIPVKPGGYDIDAPIQAAISALNSPEMQDRVTEAMAWPYRFGVTQMPCAAKALQPERRWRPVREPSGKILWTQGPVTMVHWGGIYGTCIIETREEPGHLGDVERTVLECQCNGWLPAR